MIEYGTCILNVTHDDSNATCTIVNLTSESVPKEYSFLTTNTEELTFNMATIDVLNLTNPLYNITPWKLVISNSNVTQVVFPAHMSPTVVQLLKTEVEDVHFEDNISLQEFRAEYTSLRVVSPTVSRLAALDILWVSSSQLINFNFDILENSSVSLLYLVSNRIEIVTVSPGVACCKNLDEIFLSNNLLKQLDVGTFATMRNLKAIFLENNKLTDLYQSQSLDAIEYRNGNVFCSWRKYYSEQEETEQELETPNCTDFYATLLSIQLARNELAQINFSAFSWMNNLNLLDLSKNRLDSLIAKDGEVPIRLSELCVSNNNITDVYLRPIVAMKAIYMYDNNMKTLNMSNLPEELDYLNLINNPLNCDEIPQKHNSFPVLGPYTEC
uniref:Leucine rich immune protein (Coil-less) n=1 Tax=Anopheles funestus TaxID=62324 RepID=A0A182RFF9_ANOFN